MERTTRADARIGAHVASVTQDLVDIEQIAPIRHNQQGGVVGGRHEPLQRAARRRAELEPIDDVEPELDQACAEVEPSAAILHQVAAGVKRAHEAVRAAARESKPLAYLGDRETLRLAGQQLE